MSRSWVKVVVNSAEGSTLKFKYPNAPLPLHTRYIPLCHIKMAIAPVLFAPVFCYVWHYYIWSLMWNASYSPFIQHDLEVLLAWFPRWLTGPACQEFLYFHRTLVTSQQINASEAACVCWVIEKYKGHISIMDLGFNLTPLFALPPCLPRFLSKTYVLFFTSCLLSPQVSLLLLLSLREVWGWEASRNSQAIAMNIPGTFSPHLTLIFLITSRVATKIQCP